MDNQTIQTPFGRYTEDVDDAYLLIEILRQNLPDSDFPESIRPLNRTTLREFMCSLLEGYAAHMGMLGGVEFCGCPIPPTTMLRRLGEAFKVEGPPASGTPNDAESLGHGGFNLFIAVACALTSHEFECDVGVNDDAGGVMVDYRQTQGGSGTKLCLGSAYWQPFFTKRTMNGVTVAAKASPLGAIGALNAMSAGDTATYAIMTANCLDADGNPATKTLTLRFASKAHYSQCVEGSFANHTTAAFVAELPPGWSLAGAPEPSALVGPTHGAVNVGL